MNKLYSLIMVTSGLFAQTAAADVILTPEPNTPYLIEHSSSFFMTVNGDALQIMNAGSGDSQKFNFVPVEGTDATYNIQCADGRYVGSDTGWTVIFLDDPNDPFAQYTFELGHEDGYLIIHNEGRNGYLGTDANSDGSYVYTNKGGDDGKHLWRFIKADNESAIADAQSFLDSAVGSEAFPETAANALQEAINAVKENGDSQSADELRELLASMKALYDNLTKAMELSANAVVSNETGGCTEEVKAALDEAIANAMTAWSDTTPASLMEAASALEAAIAAYNNSIFTFIATPGQKYYFINTVAGLAMSINENNEVALAEYTEADNQQYELIPVEGETNYFNFKIADGSGYVARLGSWNTTVLTDPEDALTHIGFYVYDLNEKVYFLGFNQNDFLGLDDVTEGCLVYSNKKTWEEKSRWQVFEVGSSAVDEIMSGNDNLIVNAANGTVTVSGIEDGAAVSAYTVDGRLAAAGKAVNGKCELILSSGCYAVRVVSESTNAARLVYLK